MGRRKKTMFSQLWKGLLFSRKSHQIISMVLVGIMMFFIIATTPEQNAYASSKYITLEKFCEEIAKELGLSKVKGTEKSGYVNALIKAGILKEGEYKSYSGHLYRGDAALLLNRADEYLYGDYLEEDLVQVAIEKRISDINSVKKSKREDIAKAYLKGYMKGFSNGKYSTDRKLGLKNKFVAKDALNCIKMLKDSSLRAKISPDGQLIRTTNLPKNAHLFPYILASYPNDYYEWLMEFEGVDAYDYNGQKYELESMVHYIAPADIRRNPFEENFGEFLDENLDTWVEKVRTYMEYAFNVDYRTIGEEWLEGILKTHAYYQTRTYEDNARKRLTRYIEDVKKYKTIVEYDKIAVDGSSLYYYNDGYYLRTYVRYRIVSTEVPSDMDTNTLSRDKWHNKIIFTNYIADLRGFIVGEWREGHYDIRLTDMRQGSGMGVSQAIFMDPIFKYRKVK